MSNTQNAERVSPLQQPVRPESEWQRQNHFKHSNITIFPSSDSNAVLLAAMDWKNFQSLENAHALYMAVLKMMGEQPENIHLLDGEA